MFMSESEKEGAAEPGYIKLVYFKLSHAQIKQLRHYPLQNLMINVHRSYCVSCCCIIQLIKHHMAHLNGCFPTTFPSLITQKNFQRSQVHVWKRFFSVLSLISFPCCHPPLISEMPSSKYASRHLAHFFSLDQGQLCDFHHTDLI